MLIIIILKKQESMEGPTVGEQGASWCLTSVATLQIHKGRGAPPKASWIVIQRQYVGYGAANT